MLERRIERMEEMARALAIVALPRVGTEVEAPVGTKVLPMAVAATSFG
jgi:hypothetical protein